MRKALMDKGNLAMIYYLGKGEVESSILSHSTINPKQYQGFMRAPLRSGETA